MTDGDPLADAERAGLDRSSAPARSGRARPAPVRVAAVSTAASIAAPVRSPSMPRPFWCLTTRAFAPSVFQCASTGAPRDVPRVRGERVAQPDRRDAEREAGADALDLEQRRELLRRDLSESSCRGSSSEIDFASSRLASAAVVWAAAVGMAGLVTAGVERERAVPADGRERDGAQRARRRRRPGRPRPARRRRCRRPGRRASALRGFCSSAASSFGSVSFFGYTSTGSMLSDVHVRQQPGLDAAGRVGAVDRGRRRRGGCRARTARRRRSCRRPGR